MIYPFTRLQAWSDRFFLGRSFWYRRRVSSGHDGGFEGAWRTGWTEPEREERGDGLVVFERSVAGGAAGEQVGFQRLSFGSVQRPSGVQRNRFFKFFMRHWSSPWFHHCCSPSRSLDMPSLILVLTVPSGWLSRAAISAWESPS